jgi:hypothetical protein
MIPLQKAFVRVALSTAFALVVAACAAPGATPSTSQPALATMAQPYYADMRALGVGSVQVFGNGARVRVSTRGGEVYFRYPSGLAPTDFVAYVEQQGIEVDSDAYTPAASAQYEAAIKAVLPQTISLVKDNNRRIVQEQMSGGGR